MTLVEDWVDQTKALQDLPTVRLVEVCLEIAHTEPVENDDDWHVYYSLVGTMHGRGGSTEFEAACKLVASAEPVERELGCDLLGQLGWGEPTFFDESVDFLIERLGDPNERVICSAAHALGHRRSARAIEPALALVDHRNENVRYGIVMALSCHEDRRATDALIKLSRDVDRDVRDWATFGLGSMCKSDYPELRNALRDRLGEPDAEIRSEAMQGLTNRRDATVIPYINAALAEEEVFAGVLEVARTAADPALLPALLKLKSETDPAEEGYWFGCLEDAIVACTRSLTDPPGDRP